MPALLNHNKKDRSLAIFTLNMEDRSVFVFQRRRMQEWSVIFPESGKMLKKVTLLFIRYPYFKFKGVVCIVSIPNISFLGKAANFFPQLEKCQSKEEHNSIIILSGCLNQYTKYKSSSFYTFWNMLRTGLQFEFLKSEIHLTVWICRTKIRITQFFMTYLHIKLEDDSLHDS